MFKVIGFSDKPCFITGEKKNVVEVKFTDKSFSGSLSWDALFNILEQRAAEAQADNKEKHQPEQTSPSTATKTER